MALIAPLEDEALATDVSAAITQARRDGVLSSTVLPRYRGVRPELAHAQIALQSRFYDSAILPGRLLELVRLPNAGLNQSRGVPDLPKSDDVTEDDVACLADDDARFTPAERAALSFATALATDHLSIDSDEIDALRDHFTDDQVVELGILAALMVGSGRLAYAFRAFES